MKLTVKAFIVLILLCVSSIAQSDTTEIPLSTEEKTWLSAHPKIHLGGGVFPPIDDVDKSGFVFGIGRSYTDLIARKLGLQFEYSTDIWSVTHEKAKRGEIDGIRILIPATHRESYLHFTQPLAKLVYGALARKNDIGSNLLLMSQSRRVAVIKASFEHHYVKENYQDMEIVEVSSMAEGTDAVHNDNADIFIAPMVLLNHAVRRDMVSRLQILSLVNEIPSQDLAIGIKKEWPELIPILDKAIHAISPQEHAAIIGRWLPESRSLFRSSTLMLSVSERQWLYEHPVIRLGSIRDWLPVESISKDLNHEGIAADYIRLIEARLNVEFVTSPRMPWHEIVKKVQDRELDVLSAAMPTPEREKNLLFTDSYIRQPVVIVTNRQLNYIGGIENLKGKKVALARGFAISELIEKEHPELDFIHYDDSFSVLEAVSEGKAFAAIVTLATMGYVMQKHGIYNIKVSGDVPYNYRLSIAVRDDWPELVSILQKALDSITPEEKNAILNKWIGARIEKGFDYQIIWYLLGGFGAVLCVIAIFGYKQHQHKKEILQLNLELEQRIESAVSDLKQAQVVGKIGSWRYDIINDRFYPSEVARDIHGLSQTQEYFTIQELVATFHPDDISCVDKAMKEHMQNKGLFDIDHRVLLPDGSMRYVHVISRCNYEDGVASDSYGVVQDVSERMIQENRLKESNERYKKTLQNLEEQKYALDEHAIVAITDVKGTIVYVNEKFIEISGYERKELVGQNHRILSSGKHDVDFWKEMYKTVTSGQAWHAEVCNRNKNGELYWVDTTIVPFMDEVGKPKSYIAIRTDITQRVRQQETIHERDQQLMRQSRLAQMGEMISMIAHQWRQPLGAIASTVIDLKMQFELERFDLSQEEDQKELRHYFEEALSDIDSYVHTLTTTIDDFRSFYKTEKKFESELIIVPIIKALHIVRNSFESHGINIIENHQSEQELPLHENNILQVFLNILLNAQDNFKENGVENPEIHIKNYDRENQVIIEICDNGGGIPEEILPRIFDPYYSTKNEKNGTGLGLYMSKMIIEEHHQGTLKAVNREKGACFVISLTPQRHQSDLSSDMQKETE